MLSLFVSSLLTLSHTGLYPLLPTTLPGSSFDTYIPSTNKTHDTKGCSKTYALLETIKYSYQFRSRIFQELDALREPKSFVISPLAVTLGLSLLNNGVVGPYKWRIPLVLYLLDKTCIQKNGMQMLVDHLADYKETGLQVANGVFVSSKMKLRPQFIESITTTFRSTVRKVDFESPIKTSNIINSWCEDKTNNNLKTVTKPPNYLVERIYQNNLDDGNQISSFPSRSVQSLPHSHFLFLTHYCVAFEGVEGQGRLWKLCANADGDVNADTSLAIASVVHFKGKWLKPFDVADTNIFTFHDSFGVEKNVPIMNLEGSFRFGVYEKANATVLELPYQSRNNSQDMSMFIITPATPEDSTLFHMYLDNINVEELREVSHTANIGVRLPKFKITSEIDVKSIVDAMISGGIFIPKQMNLTGITESPELFVDKYVQKTVLTVDEEGTEVTTSDGLSDLDFSNTQNFTNHPFYIMICTTGKYPQIIFTARVAG